MKARALSVIVLFIFSSLSYGKEQNKDVVKYIQDISVTIRAGKSHGTGIITSIKGVDYIWGAGHVVRNLRKEREITDCVTGRKKTVVEFDDAQIIQHSLENGKVNKSICFSAKVIRYSSLDNQDLVVLKASCKGLFSTQTSFYLDEKIPSVGTDIYHSGTFFGQKGFSNITKGIISRHSFFLEENEYVFDQTTCTTFPGSSGGGVYLMDGRCIGIVTRNMGETLNIIVPIRRMREWAKGAGVEFTLDPSIKVPTEEELNKFPIEPDINSACDSCKDK